jgi:hypothetical protein
MRRILKFLLKILLVLAVVVGALLAHANYVPRHPPWRDWRPAPRPDPPEPNAYDYYKRAQDALPRATRGPDGQSQEMTADEEAAHDASVRQAVAILREGFQYHFVAPPAPLTNPLLDSSGQDPFFFAFDTRPLAYALAHEAEREAAAGRWEQSVSCRLDLAHLELDLVAYRREIVMLVAAYLHRVGGTGLAEQLGHLSAAQARAGVTRLVAMRRGEPGFADILAGDEEGYQAAIADGLDKGSWHDVASSLTDHRWPALWCSLLGNKPTYWRQLRRHDAATLAWARQQYGAARPPRPPALLAALSASTSETLAGERCRLAVFDAANAEFLTALALQAWHAEHGGYPDNLDALVPDYLSKVPTDPFIDQPLHYRRDGQGYLLYSVGPDREDDGGRPIEYRDKDGKVKREAMPDSKGDIVWGVNEG